MGGRLGPRFLYIFALNLQDFTFEKFPKFQIDGNIEQFL